MNTNRRTTILLGLLLVLVFLPLTDVSAQGKLEGVYQPLNIAHRGASGYAPENTFAAFDKAVEMKADFFELDVQMSKDGHLVVIHDPTVDRTTDGRGRVRDLTLAALKKLDAGSWFHGSFAGERIPTLDEILDRYSGKIGLFIELKKPELYPGIEEKVAQALKSRKLDQQSDGKIIVSSFNHRSVQRYHRLQPSVPVGVILRFSPSGISDRQLRSVSEYASFINVNKRMVDSSLVDRVHRLGMKIGAGTVRKKAWAKRLKSLGVDGIVTDFPDFVSSR